MIDATVKLGDESARYVAMLSFSVEESQTREGPRAAGSRCLHFCGQSRDDPSPTSAVRGVGSRRIGHFFPKVATTFLGLEVGREGALEG